MALYNGFEGSMTIGSDAAVANLESWSIDGSGSTFTASPKGTSLVTGAVGPATYKATVVAFLDPADTNGQVALTLGATISTLKFYVAGETSGDYLYSVSSAIVESVTYDDPNDYSKFNATLHLNGVPTLSAVA